MPTSEDEFEYRAMEEPQSTMSKAELRKTHKPIMEKRRRARINHCLNEIKSLILEAMNKDPSRHTKLEKADILEMAVRHLQSVQRQQLALAVAADPAVLRRFRTGFAECAAEIDRYVGRLDPGGGSGGGALQAGIGAHLQRCMAGIEQAARLGPASLLAAPALHAIARAAPASATGAPGGDLNNNPPLQLVPSRLPTGELALVLPASADYLAASRPSAFAAVLPVAPRPLSPPPSPPPPLEGFRRPQRPPSPSGNNSSDAIFEVHKVSRFAEGPPQCASPPEATPEPLRFVQRPSSPTRHNMGGVSEPHDACALVEKPTLHPSPPDNSLGTISDSPKAFKTVQRPPHLLDGIIESSKAFKIVKRSPSPLSRGLTTLPRPTKGFNVISKPPSFLSPPTHNTEIESGPSRSMFTQKTHHNLPENFLSNSQKKREALMTSPSQLCYTLEAVSGSPRAFKVVQRSSPPSPANHSLEAFSESSNPVPPASPTFFPPESLKAFKQMPPPLLEGVSESPRAFKVVLKRSLVLSPSDRTPEMGYESSNTSTQQRQPSETISKPSSRHSPTDCTMHPTSESSKTSRYAQKPGCSLENVSQSPKAFRPVQRTAEQQVALVSSTSVTQDGAPEQARLGSIRFPISGGLGRGVVAGSPSRRLAEPLCIITNQAERHRQGQARGDAVELEENLPLQTARGLKRKLHDYQGLLTLAPRSKVAKIQQEASAVMDRVQEEPVGSGSGRLEVGMGHIESDAGSGAGDGSSDMWRPW